MFSGYWRGARTARSALCFIVAAIFLFPTPAAGDPPRSCPRSVIDAAYTELNRYRTLHDREPLAYNYALFHAAYLRAVQLASRQRLSHDGWTAFVDSAGFGPHTAAAENLAAGYDTAAEVALGWYESNGHRKNLLAEKYQVMGVGCAEDERGRRWWVQYLGAR